MKQLLFYSVILLTACNMTGTNNTGLPRRHIKNVSDLEKMGMTGKIKKINYYKWKKAIKTAGIWQPDYSSVNMDSPNYVYVFDTNGFLTSYTECDLSRETKYIYSNGILTSTITKWGSANLIENQAYEWTDSLSFTANIFYTHPTLGDSVIPAHEMVVETYYPNYRLKERKKYIDSTNAIKLHMRHAYDETFNNDTLSTPLRVVLVETIKKRDEKGNPTEIYVQMIEQEDFNYYTIVSYEYYQ